MFSLESWLIEDKKPRIMPAVYNFYSILGKSKDHQFTSIIFHPSVEKVVTFENGSRILIKKLSVPSHYLRKYFSMKLMKREALNILRKERFDIVYGMTIYANVAREVGLNQELPSVARLFGSLIWDTMQNGQTIKLHTRFRYQYLEAKKPCDIIICTEDGTQFDKALSEINPGKEVHMMYNGIEHQMRSKLLDMEAVSELPSDLRLISIGRLTAWKRHDLAIDVTHHLVSDHKMNSVKLVILGKGEEKEKLDRKIKKLNLSNYIEIKDPIPHEDLPVFIKDFHIGLFLYDASNLGNALWEMALSGRLICTRPTGKTSDLFADKVNCILSNDPKIMASKINSYYNKNVGFLTNKSRRDISGLLPPWEERIESEMKLIQEGITNLSI